jgi:hypothetical protein
MAFKGLNQKLVGVDQGLSNLACPNFNFCPQPYESGKSSAQTLSHMPKQTS